MPCLSANSRARAGSRAATAVTTTSDTTRDGLTSAVGVILAAPSVPTLSTPTTPPWPSALPVAACFHGFGNVISANAQDWLPNP